MLLVSKFMPDGKLTHLFFIFFSNLSELYLGCQSMLKLFLLKATSPTAKEGIMRPAVKSNECRCIYEMQASVYSNNFPQWGISL